MNYKKKNKMFVNVAENASLEQLQKSTKNLFPKTFYWARWKNISPKNNLDPH
jgi:hypothetical protein